MRERLGIVLVGGFGGLFLAADAGYAQRGPLVADRPDFTEAAETVGPGVIQVEFGYTLAYDELRGDRDGGDRDGGDGTVWTHFFGEPLLRVGVAHGLELRFAASPVSQRTRTDDLRVDDSGTEDLDLGIKLVLARQVGRRPAIAVIPQMTLPTGSEAFSRNRLSPGVNLIYAWDLTEEVSLAGSTQVNRAVTARGEGYAEWAQSLVTGLVVGARTGVYAEWYALFHAAPQGTRTEHYANGGFTWSVADDIQWDIRLGAGLNEAATDFFAGTGFALRIP